MRTAVLFLYNSLFPKPRFKILSYAVSGLVVAVMVGSIIQSLVNCTPIAYHWDKTITGHCISYWKGEVASGAINAILDLILVIMPIPVVWQLQMPLRGKITVTAIFSLALM